MRIRILLPLLALLAACGAHPPPATDAQISAAAWRAPGPASLTLITVLDEDSGLSAHTALMINADQRVIFDPAGSFGGLDIVEREDVLYGITPEVLTLYLSYYGRLGYFVRLQTVAVSEDVALRAVALVQGAGSQKMGTCTMSSAALLQQIQGFEAMPSAPFPADLMAAFGALPGVVTTEFHEDDSPFSPFEVARYNWRYDFEDCITLEGR